MGGQTWEHLLFAHWRADPAAMAGILPPGLELDLCQGRAWLAITPFRLHGLRHAAGSLVARTSDPVFVRDFLGHRKLSTTDRYVSAKARPEELERLDAAFAPASARAPAVK